MTVSKMLIAAVFALAAGVAVENAKATQTCQSGVGQAAGCAVAVTALARAQ